MKSQELTGAGITPLVLCGFFRDGRISNPSYYQVFATLGKIVNERKCGRIVQVVRAVLESMVTIQSVPSSGESSR
jgi:hypothetical protein